MIDRKAFFDAVRKEPFPKRLTTRQVDGMEAILAEWERRRLTDLRWLAYMLATTYHETARTMQPIEEYGKGKGREYGKPAGPYQKVYYGRGFVQLTWLANYQKAAKALGVDLVRYPERALEAGIAAAIMFDGMMQGWFTGKKLSDYFAGTKADWVNARRIVNGVDKASEIAGYARLFHAALTAADKPDVVKPPVPVPPVPGDGLGEPDGMVGTPSSGFLAKYWGGLFVLLAGAGFVLWRVFG